MSPFRAQVTAALEAVALHPSGACSWCGHRLARPPARVLPAAAERAYLRARLEQVLYESFYCPGAPIPPAAGEPEAEPRADAAFVDALSAANAGRGCWAGGWRVEGRIGDDVLVRKDGLRLRARPAQALVRGGAARIRLPKELPAASPGFYVAVSDADLAAGRRMIRLYFHLGPSAAPRLVRTLTVALNGIGLPFRLKVLDAPERFTRRDAAVLYARAVDFEGLRPVLGAVAAGIRLRAGTPALTKPLRPGIGLAEHPASHESFGGHRCRLLAEAIVAARERGITSAGARLGVVEAHFAAHGIDLDAPYLEPGSRDRYVR